MMLSRKPWRKTTKIPSTSLKCALALITMLAVGCTKSCTSSSENHQTAASQQGAEGTAGAPGSPDAPANANGSAGSATESKAGPGLTIGVAVAQTSNVSLLGQEQVAGVRLAEKIFNEEGGIQGRPIRVVVEDTGGDENGAINAFQSLISKHNAVGIVGPTLSQQAFGADPIAERAKVPVLAPSNTAKGIPDIGDFIARVSAPIATVAPNAIAAALKINGALKKVAVLYAQNDAFSKSETEIFQEALKAKGLNIVSIQTFQTSDTDFQAQATATLQAKPELVVISGLAADGGNLVRQLRELGYQGLMIGGNGLNTSNVFPVCGIYCDGLLVAQAYSPENPAPGNQKFRARYQGEYKKEPPQFSAQAYTAIQVFVEALRALPWSQENTMADLASLRTSLNAKLLQMTYQTPLGEISFAPNGEVVQKQFFVAQIHMEKDGTNGRFQFLAKD